MTSIQESLAKGIQLMMLGKYAQAENILSRALATASTNASLLTLLAECIRRQGRRNDAKKYLYEALEIDSSSEDTLYLLALIYCEESNFRKAEEYATSALRLNAESAKNLALLGLIQHLTERPAAGEKNLDKALSIDPEDVTILNLRSMLKTAELNFRNSSKLLLSALSINPLDAFSHYLEGVNQLRTGKIESAKWHFQQSMQHDPSDSIAREKYLNAVASQFFLFRFLNSKWFLFNIDNKVYGNLLVLFTGIIFLILKTKVEAGRLIESFIDLFILAIICLNIVFWIALPVTRFILQMQVWKDKRINWFSVNLFEIVSMAVAWTCALLMLITENTLFTTTGFFIVAGNLCVIFRSMTHEVKVRRVIGYAIAVMYAIGLTNLLLDICLHASHKLLQVAGAAGWMGIILLQDTLENYFQRKTNS